MAAVKLHSYQDEAADILYERDHAIWVAEMGAGKTLTALTAIKAMLDDRVVNNVIVWAPKRVAQTVWVQEAEKHGLGLDIETLAGVPPKIRSNILRNPPQVLVVNYELAPWLHAQDVRATPRTLTVFDELTRLQEATGQRRKKIVDIVEQSPIRWGLTGTPKGNREIVIWGQVDMIKKGIVDRSFYVWRGRWFRQEREHVYKILPGCEEIVDEQYAEVAFSVDIPKQPEAVLLEDVVVLPPNIMERYREFEQELVTELAGREILTLHEIGAAMKCRQIAGGFAYTETGDVAWAHDAKLDALGEIVETGENLLCLYQFRPEVDAIRARFGQDIPVLGMGTTDKQAADIIDRWNRREIPLLLGHPASMGHGLNLQYGGRRVVWYSLTWSLEEYLQTNARLNRQGQEKTVYVHHLVARGTIDRRVGRALREKKSSQDALMELIRNVA